MTGPFKPEDFSPLTVFCSEMANAANRADAKRWVCPATNGEHIPIFDAPRLEHYCSRCGVALRQRWEAE